MITMQDPTGIALVLGVALVFAAIRFLPRLLLGKDAYISAFELHQQLQHSDMPHVLIDVRNPSEFATPPGHIPGSQNWPLASLKQQLPQANWDKQPLILICHSDTRAQLALRMMRQAGHTQAKILSGGIMAWQDEAYPLTLETA